MKIRKTLSIATHITVLASLTLFTIFPLTFQFILPKEFWYCQIYQLVIWVTIFYSNMYYNVPKFLLKGRSFEFTILTLSALVFTIIVHQKLAQFHNLPEKMDAAFKMYEGTTDPKFGLISTFISATITLLLLVISTSIKVGDQLRKENTRKQELIQEKVASELAFLKAQINPHFLFNILHSIYALTETDASKSQDAIYTLSKMMRYVLYDSKHPTTSLEKEIALIENYIKLMRLRTGEHTEIIFLKPERINTQLLAPMLFLPFVENAFKHGISSYEKSIIAIQISQAKDSIQLTVTNTIFPKKDNDLEENSGIGLLNTKRRLDLLYPSKYQLQMGPDSDSTQFLVDLKIYLS